MPSPWPAAIAVPSRLSRPQARRPAATVRCPPDRYRTVHRSPTKPSWLFQGRVHGPRRTDQLQQHILWITAELMRDLSDERLNRPGMRHVVDRSEPADADMRLRLAALQPDVRHVERRVDESHPELDELRIFRVGHEIRKQARRRAAVPPGNDLVVLVDARLEALRRHGVIEAVLDVVLASPHHLDRRAVHRLGQKRRLDGEVPFRLAAETATEQRCVKRHVLGVDTKTLGDVVAGAARALDRRPDVPLAVGACAP